MNIQVNGACVNTSVRTLKEFLDSTAYKDKLKLQVQIEHL